MLDNQPEMEGVMDWYLMVWRKYAEFNGRSRRKEYWMFVLFNLLAALVLAALGGIGLAISEDYGGVLFIPFGLYILAVIIPGLAVQVRRLHDSGKSGWLLLLFFVLGFIPIVGFIATVVQIVLMCIDSDPGDNEYGPNPKAAELAGMAAGNAGFTSMGLGVPPQPVTGTSNYGVCGNCGTAFKDATPFCSHCGVRRQ
jgi:uncharacterized membrane protein YhaH (DUF805 family)